MPEPPVVNASPLILLARAERFDLLRVAGEALVVPAAVALEIGRRGPSHPTFQAMQAATWRTVVEDPPLPPSILAWDVGPGESALLAWGRAGGCRITRNLFFPIACRKRLSTQRAAEAHICAAESRVERRVTPT